MGLKPGQYMVLTRASAELVLARLRFLTCPVAAGETFSGTADKSVSADQWAAAAWALALVIELGHMIEMDPVNITLLVEALEGSQVIRQACELDRPRLIDDANSLAAYLERYAGRRVIPDSGPLAAQTIKRGGKLMDTRAFGERPSGAIDGVLIAQRVSEAILSGALPAGTRVQQQVLADHFGVSRMPVREALRVVQARGLLEHRPNRSPVVVDRQENQDPELQEALARIADLEEQLSNAQATLDRLSEALRACQ